MATRVTDRFPEGVVLLDLSPVREPKQVLPALARALDVYDAGNGSLVDQLCAYLREQTMLVVLDNFEHVLQAAANFPELLTTCPNLRFLVTSREPLQLRWEQIVPIAPLPVPSLTNLPPLKELVQVPSVAIFLERTMARCPEFTVTEDSAPLLAQLVVGLDGIPLALELAAARMNVLTLPTIVRRLNDQLQLLHWEAQDVPERQRSLEAAVRWSYDLLAPNEQQLFRCLGVFVGRVTLEALATVASHGGPANEQQTLAGMLSLAEKSLIVRGGEMDDDGVLAFGMLETIREFAHEQLVQQGELKAAVSAHAHYFLALAERADPFLRRHEQRTWFLRLEHEHDNLRAALRWLLDKEKREERIAASKLAGALGYFWAMRGYFNEGIQWLEQALRFVTDVAPVDHLRLLLRAGMILTHQAEFERAQAVLQEANALAQQHQHAVGAAEAVMYLGACAAFAGKWQDGKKLLHDALGRWQDLDDHFSVGFTLLLLTDTSLGEGSTEEAVAFGREALEQFQMIGDERVASTAHFTLAVFLGKQGDLAEAIAHLQAGLQISVLFKDRWLLSSGVGALLLVLGDRADLAQQARLLGAEDALAQATGATIEIWKKRMGAQGLAKIRDQLEREELAAAYRDGRLLAFAGVASLALALLEECAHPLLGAEPRQQSQLPTAKASQLSERQLEVLQLVAKGYSNKAIARQLIVSSSTVNYHVTAIFHKLGVDTRAQAVAIATQHGLI